MKMIRNTVLLFSVCIVVLTGCFSSTRIYKQEYIKNDSTFVQRDVGAEVLIKTNDSKEYTGELLTVSECTMILGKEYGLNEEESLNSVSTIYMVQNKDIKSIWVLGEDNHLIGLGIGLGVGIPIIIGSQPEEGAHFGNLEIAGLGLISIVTGFLVGAATSTYDEEIFKNKNAEDFEFIQLNIYSRYGGKEPEYLKVIK